MRRNGFAPVILIIVVALILVVVYFLYPKVKSTPVTEITPTGVPEVSTETASPTTTLKAGWTTYKNEMYGFEISHPTTYKALDDEENLSGWPNAVLLLYKGGQAYDVVIEVWDSKEAYEASSPASSSNVVAKEVEGKYITVTDYTLEEENAEIMSTFIISE